MHEESKISYLKKKVIWGNSKSSFIECIQYILNTKDGWTAEMAHWI